jgi:hypothetical protein
MTAANTKAASQRRLLVGLVVCAATVALWRGGIFEGLVGGDGLPGFGSRSAEIAALLETEVVELRLDDLVPSSADYAPGRDPFRYAPAPRPPEQPREVIERPPPRATPLPPPGPVRTDSPELLERPVRTPPKVDVKYLGSFGPKGRKIAVLTDQAELYNAQVGDVVKGMFQVDEIGYESVVLSFVGYPEAEPATLVLGG